VRRISHATSRFCLHCARTTSAALISTTPPLHLPHLIYCINPPPRPPAKHSLLQSITTHASSNMSNHDNYFRFLDLPAGTNNSVCSITLGTNICIRVAQSHLWVRRRNPSRPASLRTPMPCACAYLSTTSYRVPANLLEARYRYRLEDSCRLHAHLLSDC
jgi:hypothetical protein